MYEKQIPITLSGLHLFKPQLPLPLKSISSEPCRPMEGSTMME